MATEEPKTQGKIAKMTTKLQKEMATEIRDILNYSLMFLQKLSRRRKKKCPLSRTRVSKD